MHNPLESNLQLGDSELVLLPMIIRKKKCVASNYILVYASTYLNKITSTSCTENKDYCILLMGCHQTFI